MEAELELESEPDSLGRIRTGIGTGKFLTIPNPNSSIFLGCNNKIITSK